MPIYEYVTVNVSGNEAKHVAAFNETLNRYAAEGWTVDHILRPSEIGPLNILFIRED